MDCGDQRRLTGNGSALEVGLHDYALYKSTFTLLLLTYSKLNMIYLAELLVVMTDRLKTVIIHARNVLRIHEHKRLEDDDASHASLAAGKRQCRVLMLAL